MAPIMIDLQGTELQVEERDMLQHPAVGGVILFTRNYDSPDQLIGLVRQMREARSEILLAVDHEGGRVQRFRQGFSELPAMGQLLRFHQSDINAACADATSLAWLMASELLSVGIDISFAPVCDIDGISEVIGDRGFSDNVEQVVALAGAFCNGMHEAGMATTGKHFPGHGSVLEDSHIAIPRDQRSRECVLDQDMSVFVKLHQQSALDAVMPAHVIYSEIDPQPAGFSSYWLQTVLRKQLGFNGAIFSDDLSMEGATVLGSYPDRCDAALMAGCDMVLVCNAREGAIQVLDHLSSKPIIPANDRLNTMWARKQYQLDELRNDQRWKQAQKVLQRYA